MVLADPWYNSGTFWAAAGAIAVLGTGAVATFVAFWLANPIRRLDCAMSAAPLLKGSAQEMPGSLHITWDGVELKDPHILEVTLTSRGRRDIASEDFDQPLEFRVGATIKAILRTASGPKSSTFRAVSFKDDTLSIGPGLIRRRQSIKFTLLAVGREPMLSSAATALRDVDVEVLSTDSPQRRWALRTKVAVGVAVTAGAAGLVLIGLLIGHQPARAKNPPVANRTPTNASPSAARSTPTNASPSANEALLAAEADLKSGSQSAQSSGITSLQRIMNASPSSQPAAMKALASFIRSKSPAGNNDQPVTAIVQAALNVLRNRSSVSDAGTLITLDNTNLTNASLSGINLSGASLVNTDFSNADLGGANLRHANLNYAFVGDANLDGADLTGANLVSASFYHTLMCRGSVPTQPQRGYNCSASG
jgi:pentapeptide repeat protein